MAAVLEIKYFNTFILKNLDSIYTSATQPAAYNAGAPDPHGYPSVPVDYAADTTNPTTRDWYIEESRIRGGYNNTTVDFGVKAYIVEDEPNAAFRGNSLIYSGIYNSRTGFNGTNVFSVGENITKSVDPAYGSIQKLYAEDTNLIILQEDKVSRALIDKDAIYSAEGGGTVTSTNLVIGQIAPFAGEYGISKDPESFAVNGYRKYFTDRRRNVVLRLSADGITEISAYGMKDWFRDSFGNLAENDRIVGAYDNYNKQYVLSLLDYPEANNDGRGDVGTEFSYTLAFDDKVKGWTSFYSYLPNTMGSLRNRFYTTTSTDIYLHNNQNYTASVGPQFYGVDINPNITFVFNQNPSVVKNFKTINFEGTSNWKMESFITDYENAKSVIDYDNGAYFQTGIQQPFRAGFDRKENKYFANLISNNVNNPNISTGNPSPLEGLVITFDSNNNSSKSGLKGFYSTVKFSSGDIINSTFQPLELFAVSTEYNVASY